MKHSEISAATAALLFIAGISGAGAAPQYDGKNWAGYSCIPQISQEQHFTYQIGGLTNLSFKPRVVFCPLMRDNAPSVNSSQSLRDLELRAVRPGSATTPLKCTLRFRSKTGSVLFAQTRSSTHHGNVTLDFDPGGFTVAGNQSRGTWDLQCIISERTTIRNYRIAEYAPTDVDAGL